MADQDVTEASPRPFRVLVAGDMMVDHYVHVRTSRRAEEAPIPVWDEVRNEYRLGGAANVAHNLRTIGGQGVRVSLAGICGSSVVSYRLRELGIDNELVVGQETMMKRRYVDPGCRLLFRADNFRKFDTAETSFFEYIMAGREDRFDAVVFSDYDKGTLTQATVDVFRKMAPLTVVDSKRADLRLFEGMDVLKVNAHEYGAQVGSPFYHNFTELFGNVVVTQGDQGALLIMCERSKSVDLKRLAGNLTGPSYVTHTEHFPVDPVEAKDVTGCGDTHTAALALSLLKTRDIRAAVRFANACASDVVQKFGTAVADVL